MCEYTHIWWCTTNICTYYLNTAGISALTRFFNNFISSLLGDIWWWFLHISKCLYILYCTVYISYYCVASLWWVPTCVWHYWYRQLWTLFVLAFLLSFFHCPHQWLQQHPGNTAKVILFYLWQLYDTQATCLPSRGAFLRFFLWFDELAKTWQVHATHAK